ncbi:DUF5695 domain-containing protein [Terriglobus albidus]|uniref:DUF5695 domain-containing protein n=1 Tax=Terriglobus albidus TaxID=1592106 RepID=UPI0021DFAAEF|nr:DUF5695 domain-containing protein [Terriglobus albidus]
MSFSPLFRLSRAVLLSSLVSSTLSWSQPPKPLPPGPMLDGGRVVLKGKELTLELLAYSGTVAQLRPTADPMLDYTPGDLLKARSADTFYHLGDLDLRLRDGASSEWKDYSTAYRRKPVQVLANTSTSFRADLAATLPAEIPLRVVREWSVRNGDIYLGYTLTNRTHKAVHLGGIGVPMVFNNIMNGHTLEQSYTTCSFYDPYIGQDAGYVQVARLSGTGPALLIAPEGHAPLEAWKPILDKRVSRDGEAALLNDPTRRGMTFEGSYEWMIHSAGFADTDWKGAEQWNQPTEDVLQPGKSVTYTLHLFVAPSLREIEATLTAHGRPVAIGIPGYILPQDTDGRLFLRSASPVTGIISEPEGALTIHHDGLAPDGKTQAYTIHGLRWGRARLRITYGDGNVQTIAYRTIKPETQTVTDLGRFLFHEQWFEQPNDPFHRSPSIISYDNDAGKQLVQESRVWIAGLSDEGGAGSWLAAAMKEAIAPDPEEVRKLEAFVNQTVWGHLQESEGPQKFGIHKSLFYYQPDEMPTGYYDASMNWGTWTSWNRKDAADIGRSFNYPHVVAAYWSLYRIARNSSGLTAKQDWKWYLDHAYETTMAMRSHAPYYTQFGQMEGTIFTLLLHDLKMEGWKEQAATLEGWMRERAQQWNGEPYPFGSEMPWDSTGQEEVYAWTRYFGFKEKADLTLNAILAYTPVVPSWGYNGSARRYWDFLYGGKYPRIERQLHHYGSGLNAIPLLSEYRAHPNDLYLLRAGYGGVMGPLANIDEKGFGSAAFHSYPDRMQYDPYTGDYGPNFLGHVLNTGAYLVQDPVLGWLAFGGNLAVNGNAVRLTVLDSARQRVYLAPTGQWLTLDGGAFTAVEYDTSTHQVTVHLAPATAYVKEVKLHISSPTTEKPEEVRTVSLSSEETRVPLVTQR